MIKKLLLILLFCLITSQGFCGTAITSAQTGVWSDVNTWTGGAVPVANDTVTIQAGHIATIDQSITVGVDNATPAINISAGGQLIVPSTVAANYVLALRGNLSIYGNFTVGNITNPLPSTRTFTVQTNFADTLADGKHGIIVQTGGNITLQGNTTIDRCKLNANATTVMTAMSVDTNTGWVNGQDIAIASTSQTRTECERRLINDTNTTAINVTANLTYSHTGVSPIQGEVILLTRNINITSWNNTAVGFVYFATTSTADIDYVEFSYLGENVANKRGLEIATTTGSFNMQHCSLHDFEDGGFYYTGNYNNTVTRDCVSYNLASADAGGYVVIGGTSGTSNIFDGNIFMYSAGANQRMISVGETGDLYFCNNTVIASRDRAVNLYEDGGFFTGKFNNNTIHSSAATALQIYNEYCESGKTLSDITIWRNGGGLVPGVGLTFANLTMFGNSGNQIDVSGMTNLVFINPIISGDTTFASTAAFIINSGYQSNIIIKNGQLGVASGIKVAHTTADISFVNTMRYGKFWLYNTVLGSSTESTVTSGASGSFVRSHDHNATQYRYKSAYKYGNLTDNTTTSMTDQTGTGTCLVMTPNSATAGNTLKWEFKIPVTAATDPQLKFYVKSSGGTPTLNIDVYDSDDDNTLLVDNSAISLTGSWAQYSVASISPTDTGWCRIVLKALGDATPTESIGIDTLTFVSGGSTYTYNFEEWADGEPRVFATGAGGSVTTTTSTHGYGHTF